MTDSYVYCTGLRGSTGGYRGGYRGGDGPDVELNGKWIQGQGKDTSYPTGFRVDLRTGGTDDPPPIEDEASACCCLLIASGV